MAIWIDLDIGPFMRGLGDALTLAWLAEGVQSPKCKVQSRIAFRTSGPRLELLKLFGQEAYDRETQPDDLPPPVAVSDAYAAELADGGRRPRLEYLAEHLGVPAVWARPQLSPKSKVQSPMSSPVYRLPSTVYLFPQTHWPARAWPACYWVDLAWQLRAAGHAVDVLLERPDPRYRNVPHFTFGLPLAELVARVAAASLVIANDSFGAHLAGTLGVPCIALLGPTRAECVFAHFQGGSGFRVQGSGNDGPDGPFVCLTSELNCTGCHFRPATDACASLNPEPRTLNPASGFRAACDQGCLSLHRLLPETVLETALQLLDASREASREEVQSP